MQAGVNAGLLGCLAAVWPAIVLHSAGWVHYEDLFCMLSLLHMPNSPAYARHVAFICAAVAGLRSAHEAVIVFAQAIFFFEHCILYIAADATAMRFRVMVAKALALFVPR